MKFGFRIPSLSKRIAARTSLKRVIRHNLGLKAPKGFGWFTNPKKAAYNKIYNKTSRGCLVNLLFLVSFGVLTFLNPFLRFQEIRFSSRNLCETYNYCLIQKGYVRRNVSSNKNTIKIQNRSLYY